MRRALAAALLALFTTQSSGAAMASSSQPRHAPPLLAQVQLEFSQALQALSATPLGVFLLDQKPQYKAMHAQAPVRLRMRPTGVTPQMSRDIHSITARPTAFGMELPRPKLADPRQVLSEHFRDPLAMRKQNTLKPFTVHNQSTRTPFAVHTMGSGVSLTSSAPATTGINRWWTYEEGGVPGVGKTMINVANGNLMVQVDDVDVSERGVDLAFRRTYNSQSQHTWSNDDGEGKAIYGAGWTNNLEAHLDNGPNGDLTVYDIDGARYDYAPDGNGGWIAPAGQYAKLQYDGNCGYDWTKKTGTTYVFWSPNLSTTSGCTAAAYTGRLAAIYGRNMNNSITLNYYWDTGSPDGWIYLNTIVAQHSDGHALTLRFRDVTTGTGTERLLQSLARPDGSEVTYGYDSSGTLSTFARLVMEALTRIRTIRRAREPCQRDSRSFTTSTATFLVRTSSNWSIRHNGSCRITLPVRMKTLHMTHQIASSR